MQEQELHVSSFASIYYSQTVAFKRFIYHVKISRKVIILNIYTVILHCIHLTSILLVSGQQLAPLFIFCFFCLLRIVNLFNVSDLTPLFQGFFRCL